MKLNTAVFFGGESVEHEVSIISAHQAIEALDKEKYNVYIVTIIGTEWNLEVNDAKYPVDKNDFSAVIDGLKIKFDYAYITIHGAPGEDGKLQGYFELMKIPYSSCGVLASALTYNKFTCNTYLKNFGIPVAKSLRLRSVSDYTDKEIVDAVGLPCFVKPNDGGSSFGVTKVKTIEQVKPAVKKAFAEGSETVIESFMQGTEITCGIYKAGGKTTVFPITEVVSENEFFDYDAKYKGQVKEITPARISEETAAVVRKQTERIYNVLDAHGIIRVDYIISADGTVNLLEVNTTPGMTPTSLLPQEAKVLGYSHADLCEEIVRLSLEKGLIIFAFIGKA